LTANEIGGESTNYKKDDAYWDWGELEGIKSVIRDSDKIPQKMP